MFFLIIELLIKFLDLNNKLFWMSSITSCVAVAVNARTVAFGLIFSLDVYLCRLV